MGVTWDRTTTYCEKHLSDVNKGAKEAFVLSPLYRVMNWRDAMLYNTGHYNLTILVTRKLTATRPVVS